MADPSADPGGGGVTYPQMVGYVDRINSRTTNVVRDEMLKMTRSIDSMRTEISDRLSGMDKRQTAHDEWHRKDLERQLAAQGPAQLSRFNNWLLAGTLIVAVVALVLSNLHR